MISFDEAMALTLAAGRPRGQEEVTLAEAHRRVLAAPVIAQLSAPREDCSSMDGYAVRDADLAQLPAQLPVRGASFPGAAGEAELPPGACVRIFTGGRVPRGADRVVIQEVVRRDGDVAIIEGPIEEARYIRAAGSDFRAGDLLLEQGALLGPRQIVAAAAADLATLRVWKRPRLMILSTGDELAAPGTARTQSNLIPDSVSFGVAAMAEAYGARVIGSVSLADQLTEMEQAAEAALRDADLVVVTGGASVGEKDFARRMFAGGEMELIFSKVAIKPGKPVWLGRVGERIVLGLPGNPTSAIVTARLFLAPLLGVLTGRDPAAALSWRKLPLVHDVAPSGDRETFARGIVTDAGVQLLPNQDSGAQKTLADCTLLVRIGPSKAGMPAGEMVDVADF